MAFYQKVSEQGIIFFLDNLEDFLSFTKKVIRVYSQLKKRFSLQLLMLPSF